MILELELRLNGFADCQLAAGNRLFFFWRWPRTFDLTGCMLAIARRGNFTTGECLPSWSPADPICVCAARLRFRTLLHVQ